MRVRWDKRRYSDVRGYCGWSRWSSGCEPVRVTRRAGRHGRRGKTLAHSGRPTVLGRAAGGQPPGGGWVAGGAGQPRGVAARVPGVGPAGVGVWDLAVKGDGDDRGAAVGAAGQQGQRPAACAAGGGVCAPVHPPAGDRPWRVNPAAVRAGGAGGRVGWPVSRVLVIDEDLGKSGSSAAGRVGFGRLVTEITMGHVGLVLGIEMSRLARSGADWYQLLERCALSGALLADADGIYDPVDYNDRLLLGLKGTMSEAELHLPEQRMLAGKQAKARRGELAIGLPTGYVRRPSGEAALDPDEQVQTVVRLVFAKFAELGTLHGCCAGWSTTASSWGCGCALGRTRGSWSGGGPTGCPAEHPPQPGLRRDLRLRPPPGRPSPTGAGPAQHRPGRAGPDEWLVMIPGCCPPTSPSRPTTPTWPAWPPTPPAPRPPGGARGVGTAVGAGALRTLRPAHDGALPPPWPDHGPEYVCARQLTDYGQGQRGQAWPAPVSTRWSPSRSWPPWPQPRSRSPCRQPSRCRPSGPSWSGSGSSDWSVPRSAPIGRGAAIGWPSRRTAWWCGSWEPTGKPRWPPSSACERTTTGSPAPAPAAHPAQQRAIVALAGDIEGLWAAPTTTDADRKQIIRTLVDQVTITVAATSEHVTVTIGWAGGHTTGGQTIRPLARLEQLSSYPQLVERVRQLAEQGHRAQAIARRLHAEGFRPAKGRQRIGISAITQLVHQLGCPGRTPATASPAARRGTRPHEWWLDDLAAELAMPPITLHSWIRRGWVHARQESRRPYRWIIHTDGHQPAELRQRRSRPPGWYPRRRWADSEPPANNGSRDHAASPPI